MSLLEAQASDVVLVSERSETMFILEYFFEAIFGLSTRLIEDLSAALVSAHAQKISTMKLFALHINEFDDSTRELVEAVKTVSPSAFVLVLTDDARPETSVRLFEANVDEVVRFPFELMELAYRLRARSHEIGLAFDFDKEQARKLKIASDIVRCADLTEIEAQVMRVLLAREGEIVSRDELSRRIDNTSWDYGNRKFDVHVSHIRKKLNSALPGELTVRTVRAAGYKLALGRDIGSNRD